jgi:hypothetical protein
MRQRLPRRCRDAEQRPPNPPVRLKVVKPPITSGVPDDRPAAGYPNEAVAAQAGRGTRQRLPCLPDHGLAPRHVLRDQARLPGRRGSRAGGAETRAPRPASQPGLARGRGGDPVRAGPPDLGPAANRERAPTAGSRGRTGTTSTASWPSTTSSAATRATGSRGHAGAGAAQGVGDRGPAANRSGGVGDRASSLEDQRRARCRVVTAFEQAGRASAPKPLV